MTAPPPAPAGAGDALRRRKAELRRRILAARDALDPETRRRRSEAILARLEAVAAVRAAAGVLAYASIGSEPATAAFLRAVLARGQALALPRVDRPGRRLELYRVTDLERDLRPGVWGIPEPDPARCPPAPPAAIDVVLVPGVAFDVRGGRVGYGAGYYDRLLASWPGRPLLLAAAFELQVVAEVPAGPGDRPVDRVLTEARTYPTEAR